MTAAAEQHITASAMPTIELGEVGPLDESRLGMRGLANRGTPPHVVRGLAAAGLALSCLLGLTASVRPALGLSNPLWTTTLGLTGFSAGSESIYLIEPGGKMVTGRWLETGELRWRLETQDLVTSTAEVGDGVAAVLTHNIGAPADQQPDTGIVGVSEVTGHVLFGRPGHPLAPPVAGRLLLVASNHPSLALQCPDEPAYCADVSAIDLNTGAEAWRISLPMEARFLVDSSSGGAGKFATLGLDGSLVVWDGATGAVTERGELPGPGPETQGTTAALVGDTLVTGARERDRAEIIGYRLGPLRRVWSLTVPLVVPITEYNSWFFLSSCADLMCLHVNGGHTIIDPRSGKLRVRLSAEVIKQLGGGGLLALPPTDQRLPAGSRKVVLLIDPTSGRTVTTFPDSVMVDWPDSGRALLLQPGAQRTGFTIVDEHGRPHPLGSVAGTGLNCMARRAVLACSEPGGLLRVWRLPT